MTELPTNNENELLQEEWEDLLDETFLDEITAEHEIEVAPEIPEDEDRETIAPEKVQEAEDNEFKRGFVFGLGFWSAGALVMSIPFGAILFAVYSVITTML